SVVVALGAVDRSARRGRPAGGPRGRCQARRRRSAEGGRMRPNRAPPSSPPAGPCPPRARCRGGRLRGLSPPAAPAVGTRAVVLADEEAEYEVERLRLTRRTWHGGWARKCRRGGTYGARR